MSKPVFDQEEFRLTLERLFNRMGWSSNSFAGGKLSLDTLVKHAGYVPIPWHAAATQSLLAKSVCGHYAVLYWDPRDRRIETVAGVAARLGIMFKDYNWYKCPHNLAEQMCFANSPLSSELKDIVTYLEKQPSSVPGPDVRPTGYEARDAIDPSDAVVLSYSIKQAAAKLDRTPCSVANRRQRLRTIELLRKETT